MVNEPDKSVNAIIAQALANAGVPPRNIEVPPVAEAEPAAKVPTLDGKPKGQVQGESPEEKATREAEEAKAAGAPAVEPPKPAPGEPPVQPLGKAEIETAITEASSKFQSLMDRKINQLQYQMTQTITALNQFFQSQEDASVAGLPENEQVLKRLGNLEKGVGTKIQIQANQPISQQPAQFYQQLVGFVDAVGLKVDDKRIDWAPDTDNPQVGFNRFLTSVKAALVEDQTKVIQALKDDGNKVLTNLRKKTGVDKVSATGPSGAGVPDIDKMNPMQKIEYGYAQQEQLSQVAQ